MTWLVVIVKFAVALWPKYTSAFTPGCTCDVTMLRLCRSFSLSSKQRSSESQSKLTRRYSRGADEFHSAGYTSSHGLLHTVDTLSWN